MLQFLSNRVFLIVLLAVSVAAVAGFWWYRSKLQQQAKQSAQTHDLSYDAATARVQEGELARATFAGGCFWCMEKPFEQMEGVRAVISGYAGGDEEDPSYEQVASGQTKHREAVQVFYDPSQVAYEQLLDTYWSQIDPTDAEGQFVDRGFQYSPAIFAHDAEQQALAERSKQVIEERDIFQEEIVVPIEEFSSFYPAEDYHQDYYQKNPVRYGYYNKASGRPQFIEENWSGVSVVEKLQRLEAELGEE
jgi:peptide methionine sulfoxide reductase msrA/msrB